MTMTFSLHESIEPNGAMDLFDQAPYFASRGNEPVREEFHLLREKLSMPGTENLIERPRINNLLKKSRHQFPATLINGRAGTGKTALAASFAAQFETVSWYTVESTDIDWGVFSRYLAASLSGEAAGRRDDNASPARARSLSQNEIARFLVTQFSPTPTGEGRLIILDDIHHIFDAKWFEDLFNLLIHFLQPDVHLLLLCRSKPPGPLWRLRSKQMLNVLDERVIAFNVAETEALFSSIGISPDRAAAAQKECFGRVSKLLQFAGN